MTRFFVTNTGLAAALKDPSVNDDLTAIIQGEAPKKSTDHYLELGYIEVDRRPAQLDNNAVVSSGLVSRLRDALGNGSQHDAQPEKSSKANGEDTTLDLRTVPKKIYRLKSNKPPLTDQQLRQLPSGARRIYAALRRMEIGTTKSLAESVGLNRRTVENSLGALRKAGVLEDLDAPR